MSGRKSSRPSRQKDVSERRLVDVSTSVDLENWVVWPKDTFQKMFEEAIASAKEGKSDLPTNQDIDISDVTSLKGEVAETIGKLTKSIAGQLHKKLPFDRSSYLIEYEQSNSAHEILLKRVWFESFELAKFQWFIARDTYSYVYNNYVRRLKGHKSHAIGSVATRSLLVFREILALCEAGFPDGALARWRTLHELLITLMVLNKLGKTSYEMYLKSEEINELRYTESIELRRKSNNDKLERIRLSIEELQNKYGKQISEDYGWAAICLNRKRVNLRDLEALVEHDFQRPEVRFASQLIHANHLSPRRLIGYPQWSGPGQPLIGPSPYGMSFALEKSVKTLTFIVLEIISMKYTIDTLVLMQVAVLNKSNFDKKLRASEKMMREYTKNVDNDWQI